MTRLANSPQDAEQTQAEQLAELLRRRLIASQARRTTKGVGSQATDRADQEAWIRGHITLAELAHRTQSQLA